MASPELVSIAAGDSVCTICPALGGSITSWSIGHQQMLRRADAATTACGDPLSLASFPLVPFSNRIGYARFIWNNREINIARNFAPEPHAIHGTGWREPWAIDEIGDTYIVLSLRHDADARWPWAFVARQSYRLNDGGLEMTLTATNLADEAAPLAFGHHPYFDQQDANLIFKAAHVFMSGKDALPTEAIKPVGQFAFRTNGVIAGRDVDHCYSGWDGHARIQWTERPLALEIEADMTAAVVYIPKGGTAFCFEPVPHINNALNRHDDTPNMPTIAAGDGFTATIRLMAVPR